MCFTGLSPTSFCRKLTLPFSLCHSAHPPSFHLACPLLSFSSSSALFTWSLSFIFSISRCYRFYIVYSPHPPPSVYLLTHLFFPLLFFLWPSSGSLCWADGQCRPETGCNYFTPTLTAVVKQGREIKGLNKKINRIIRAKLNTLIHFFCPLTNDSESGAFLLSLQSCSQ